MTTTAIARTASGIALLLRVAAKPASTPPAPAAR